MRAKEIALDIYTLPYSHLGIIDSIEEITTSHLFSAAPIQRQRKVSFAGLNHPMNKWSKRCMNKVTRRWRCESIEYRYDLLGVE